MSETGSFATGDGCRIAWRCDGPAEGPPLVLSNSLGANMAMWDQQVPEFARHFRVIRYDQRGHGESDVPTGETTLFHLGLDVLELLDKLEIERAHFCGVSLGGMTGQWLGAQAPARFDRMILSFTAPYLGPKTGWKDRIDIVLAQGTAAVAGAVAERWVTPAYAAAHPDQFAAMRAMIAATDPTGYAACCAAIRDMDLRPTAAMIARPVLVVCGADDPVTPPAMGEALAAAIPDAAVKTIPGAHLANIESAPKFNALVKQFLGAPQ